MSKAQRVKERTAREQIAARQQQARRAEARRAMLIGGGSLLLVVALVVAFAVIRLTSAPPPARPAAADTAVARAVTSVPAAAFDRVGAGTAAPLQATHGQPLLTSHGQPQVLYLGGEYCPYCAAERWALTAALSRFGTFTGLRFIRSSPADAYPDTPTLSFRHARYTSRYLSFTPVEWYGSKPDPATVTGYAVLQQPTAAQAALFRRYAGGSFPFADLGNQYLIRGAQYLPSVLSGMTWAEVAAAMHDPASPVAKDIDGAANRITAALCRLTRGQPRAVCASPGVRAAAASH